MLDPQLLREKPSWVAEQLAKRGFHFDSQAFGCLEEKRKALQIATQALQNERNERSKAIGEAKAQGQSIMAARGDLAQLAAELAQKKIDLDKVLEEIETISLTLPNLPHASVPMGADERANAEIRRWGQPRQFDFPIQSHD